MIKRRDGWLIGDAQPGSATPRHATATVATTATSREQQQQTVKNRRQVDDNDDNVMYNHTLTTTTRPGALFVTGINTRSS